MFLCSILVSLQVNTNLFDKPSAEPDLFGLCRGGKRRIQTTLKLIIIVKKPLYFAPAVRECALVIERGFAASGGFEQPEYGGEDDL